jgi:hypothetical protein
VNKGEWLWKVRVAEKIAQLEARVAKEKADAAALLSAASEKVERGANLTRGEAAAILSVSTKKLQRMEARGQLRRCPGLDGVVRYAARDVSGLLRP